MIKSRSRTADSRFSLLFIILPLVVSAAGCRNANPQPRAENSPGRSTPTACETCAAGDRIGQFESGGQIRSYRIHVPANATAGRPAPVVFGFHGNGGTAGQFEAYSGFSALADREGFIAVYPQGMGEIPTWEINAVTNNADVQFVRDLLDRLETRCGIDPDRIYAAGHSRGGGMANRLACDLADRIAAIGPVSGTYPPEGGCHPARPVAVVAFHGTADPVVPYNGVGNQGAPPAAYFAFGIPISQWASAWAARNGCTSNPTAILDESFLHGSAWNGCKGTADVILYSIPGGGHGWPGGGDSDPGNFNAAQMIWDFFVAHPAG